MVDSEEPGWPHPLPLWRRNISQSTYKPAGPSSGSLLLGRLPLEIRLLIYECIFGNRRTIRLSHAQNQANLQRESPKIQLALLRTCHQIYIEAVDIVLGSNIIDLETSIILTDLADRYLRPQRLAAIRILHIERMPCAFQRGSSVLFCEMYWQQFWGIIAHRMNLVELSLSIFLKPRGGPIDTRIDAPWVKPMLAVKGIKVLHLDIDTMPPSRPSDPRLNSLVEILRQHMMAEHYAASRARRIHAFRLLIPGGLQQCYSWSDVRA